MSVALTNRRGPAHRVPTLLADEKHSEKFDEAKVAVDSVGDTNSELGFALEEKRFWFQRRANYDPDAIATLPSVYDDPETAKQYQPRDDW